MDFSKIFFFFLPDVLKFDINKRNEDILVYFFDDLR